MKASHIARLQGTVRVSSILPSYHPHLPSAILPQDYVEAASDYRPRLPEPIELDTIMEYTRMPGLLEVILDVLRQRLKQGYPWNLKVRANIHWMSKAAEMQVICVTQALDILLWLQRHDALPRLQDSTTLQSFLPTLRELFYSPPDDPKGAAMHVKLKADDVLRKFGFEMPARPDPFGGFLRQNAGPGEWEGWSWSASGWSWGPPPASPR